MTNLGSQFNLVESTPKLLFKSNYQLEINTTVEKFASYITKSSFDPVVSGIKVVEIAIEEKAAFFCVRTLGPRLDAWLIGKIEEGNSNKVLIQYQIGIAGLWQLLAILVAFPIVALLLGQITFPLQTEEVAPIIAIQLIAIFVYFIYSVSLKSQLNNYIKHAIQITCSLDDIMLEK